jgi:DDE superfamily endonuclease
MLTYTTLQDRPREFLAATGLTHAEFAHLLPAFATAYARLYPPEKTLEGTPRQRRAGGGATGTLPQMEDKLLFILVFQKTNPLQTMHGLQFQLSQPQTNYWIHPLLPVLQRALAALGLAPERDASRVATSPLALEGAPDMAIDGTERRRQRPTNAAQPQEQYSGKKKTHTDKNLLLVNEHTDKVIYLGPTVAGTKHDKKAADEEEIAYPTNATLDKDTGFQGYEPAGVLTRQPKKPQRPGVECSGQVPQSSHLQRTRGRRKRDCRGETVPHCQRCLTSDHRGPF